MKRALVVLLKVFLLLFLLNLIIGLINISFLSPWHGQNTAAESKFHRYSGAIHIHSRHSDGSGWLPEIVEAGRQQKLDFLIISDHNANALADSAAALQNPLVISGTEFSLQEGHAVAVGFDSLLTRHQRGETSIAAFEKHESPAPHFLTIAHPFHRKIRWKKAVPQFVDGIEILNADVEWRNDSPLELIAALTGYPLFDHAMNLLIDTPQRELHWLDSLATHRPISAIGSVDAHARIKLSKKDYWRFPSYARTFALIHTALILRDSLSSDISRAHAQILTALQQGQAQFGFAGLGDIRSARIWLARRDQQWPPGQRIEFDSEGKLMLHAAVPAEFEVEIRLYRNGVQISKSHAPQVRWPIDLPGIYRIAIYQRRFRLPFITRQPVPWLFSNPFYIHPSAQAPSRRQNGN